MDKKSMNDTTAAAAGTEKGKRLVVPFGQYIHHTTRFMRFFRMWKLDSDLSKWKTILVTIGTAILLTCNFFLGVSEMIKLRSSPDLPTIASGIGSFWLHFVGFFKWLYFVWKVRDVMDLVKQLEDCYKLSLEMSESDEGTLDTSRIREEMSTAQKSSLQFTYFWSGFVTYGVVHWCMNPVFLEWSLSRSNISLTANERPLPYEAWIPWDTTSVSGYGIAYFIEFLGSFASCIGAIAYDIFYVTLLIIICAQFRYLNHFLEYQGDDDSTETSSGTTMKLTYCTLERKLKRGKVHHNAILKFLGSLEKVTSPVMFVQCIGTIGIICLVSFEATTMKLKGDTKNMIRAWSMLVYITGCFTQLFSFCYSASTVTTLGLQVGESTFNCGWELSVSERQNSAGDKVEEDERKSAAFLVREIIMRTQKPIRLTGGPFYVLSLETYRALVSAAFSYSTVLRGMGE